MNICPDMPLGFPTVMYFPNGCKHQTIIKVCKRRTKKYANLINCMSAPFASKHPPAGLPGKSHSHEKHTARAHTYGVCSVFYLHNQYEIHQSNGGRLMITAAAPRATAMGRAAPTSSIISIHTNDQSKTRELNMEISTG